MDYPAGVMRADLLTKPLQGTEFRRMRAQLMNFAMEYKDEEESTTKKRKTLIDQTPQQDVKHWDMGLIMQKYIRIM